MTNYSKDSTFNAAIKLARVKQRDSQEDFVTLFGQAFDEVAPNGKLASVFATRELKDRVKLDHTNEDVLKVIRQETKDAIDNSFNILRSRIDRFGVTQPNIQRLEGRESRILVELPGIKEPDRVRKLLQGTANLEFWETYDYVDNRIHNMDGIYVYLEKANEKLKKLQRRETTGEEDDDETEAVADSTSNEEETLIAENDSTEETSLLDQNDSTLLANDTTQTQQKSFEQYKKDNPLFGILIPLTDKEGQLRKGAAVGYSHIKDTATVMAHLNNPDIRTVLPRDIKFFWNIKSLDPETETLYELIAIKAPRDGRPPLSGDVITDARHEFGQNQATAEVTMAMNGEGAKAWAKLTKKNIDRQVAIVLDNFVYSYPVVNAEIKGGRSSITGNFDVAEAKDLANILKSGKLPAPARIIEEEIVGPSLGQEAIDSGMMSFMIAFCIVLLYMLIYYNKAGLVANVALIANIFFIIGVLASLHAVLTLPGIAGIVLTIGMSIDANVLIYERIREELRGGKTLKLAIADGYKNAYSAIIDANVTTILTGVILLVFGHGPIKGFATTLIIGILTSLFSAIFITRLIFIAMLDKKKSISFSIKATENIMKNTNIDFLGKRKIFYVISGIIIAIGLSSLFTRGLNQGVDFKGGRTYVVRLEKNVSTTDVANQLKNVFEHAPEVKTFGNEDQVKITTKFMIDEEGTNIDSIVESKLFEGLTGKYIAEVVTKENFLNGYVYEADKQIRVANDKDADNVVFGKKSSQKVGPTIADDIKVAAVYSIIFALLVMFLYIFMRFRNWRFGLGALAALAHDVLVVLGIFSLGYGFMPFSLEIDQAFIAAILTVVGYSLNDTVVVFDRIREFLNLHPKKEKEEVYNLALNSTLSRTVNTSLTTLVVLLAIFILGGEVIRGFIFALLIGVVVGTYSSLFIATPVVYDTVGKIEVKIEEHKNRRKAKKTKKAKNVIPKVVS